jgi:Serine/threonine protein kinase
MDELLQREAPLSPERAVDLLLPVIAAMSTAHKVGVVHRDLKPGNIFLARGANGEVVPKIIDFGFSKIHDDAVGGDNLTREDTALGTLSYMPMEQLMAASQAPPASDQGYRARIRNHGHSCFLCEIVIRSQFHTTYEPEA